MPAPPLCPPRVGALAACLLVAAACGSSPPEPRPFRDGAAPIAALPSAPAAPPPAAAAAAAAAWGGASRVKLDGIGLGDRYGSTVMVRPPYDAPCDDDPIDHRARRFMVYGAKPCRGRSFPEQTTLMFYLHHSEERPLDQPVEAVAWLGGTWFSSRSNFPLRVGEPLARAAEVFGPAEASFALARKGEGLRVQRHAGPVYALAERERLVGFVVGPMPDDPENEQWRGLMQMWERYTRPAEGAEGGH